MNFKFKKCLSFSKVYEEVKASTRSSSQEELFQFVHKKEISWLERKSQEVCIKYGRV